jgi:hypothetical protein
MQPTREYMIEWLIQKDIAAIHRSLDAGENSYLRDILSRGKGYTNWTDAELLEAYTAQQETT